MLFDLIEESKKLIALRSISEEGNREIAEYLAPFCRKLGFHVTLQAPGNGQGRDANLIAHTAPEGSADLCPDGLALVTHLDTVPPGDPKLWTEAAGDPFKAKIKGDKIYGLGSADTKLDFLCKLLAIEQIGLDKIKVPIALVGTFGEERSLAGARLIRESGILKPKWALIGEPSELKAVIAHKGILYLKAYGVFPQTRVGRRQGREFKGRAAHGSMPHLGDNAIEKALRWLVSQEKMEVLEIRGGTVHNVVPAFCKMVIQRKQNVSARTVFLKKFIERIDKARDYLKTQMNKDFDPPHTTDNIGVIRMPDDATIEIEFDFRLIPETDGNALYEIFRTLTYEVPEALVEVVRSNPPMNTSRQSDLAKRVGQAQQEVGLQKSFLIKSGNTEGAIFNDIGAESIVIGPGKAVGNIHAPNEHNEIPQLKKAVEFYAAFLRQFC